MARYTKSEHIFFERMQLVVISVGLVPFIISELFARSIPPIVWGYVAISSVFCSFYYLSLANAYRVRDFTTVYPSARSLPVLLMGLIDMARGRMPTTAGWLGMLLVAIGCMLSPLESSREISFKKYVNKANLWMLLTAIGTVGYSTFDKLSSELVKQGAGTAARYNYIFYAFSGVLYIAMRRAFAPDKNDPIREIGWLMPTLGGIFVFGAYWLVLWAYQIVGRASYVVAFRQFSIVIGTTAAFALYRERGFIIRMIAVLTITAGLIVIALWGK